MIESTVTFDVNLKGEINKDRLYIGTFVAKTKKSLADRLEEDRLIRQVLGENTKDASPDAYSLAAAYAFLKVTLLKYPDWWKESVFGLSLEDLNIIIEVNNRTRELISAEYNKLAEEAAKAQPALKAEADKNK